MWSAVTIAISVTSPFILIDRKNDIEIFPPRFNTGDKAAKSKTDSIEYELTVSYLKTQVVFSDDSW